MGKKILMIICLTFAVSLSSAAVPVKADTVTADNMIPVFRCMYHVDMAEAILQNSKNTLDQCIAGNAPACEIAAAQAAVINATNLLNTLNTMIARNTIMIKAAPPGVINPPSYSTNSLFAQAAWRDYMLRSGCCF